MNVLKYTAKSKDKEEHNRHEPVNRREKQEFYFSIFTWDADKSLARTRKETS